MGWEGGYLSARGFVGRIFRPGVWGDKDSGCVWGGWGKGNFLVSLKKIMKINDADAGSAFRGEEKVNLK